MKEFPIPIVPFGAGSHPEAEEANFLPMPHEMDTFSMPVQHHEADPATLAATCQLLEKLRALMQASSVRSADAVRIELSDVSPRVVELLNQSLGHGEVSIRVQGENVVRIQESIFAGVWRVQAIAPNGDIVRDSIFAGAIPPEVGQAVLAAAAPVATPLLNEGIMNAPAVLNELLDRSHNYQAGQPAHVVNLSLLPMSPQDLEYLGLALGVGPVTVLSRGYGNCRITSTRLAHVWWVQYFNSMDQLILNTLEVVDVPEAAQAAEEDYADSMERLGEWLAAMREDAA